MIGNDIVDLELAKTQSNWRRPGFLQKIFTEKECGAIALSEGKTQTVWRLWTMKEAAYKAHQRRFSLEPRFNPTDFECGLISGKKGIVEIDFEKYETTTLSTPEFIFSEARASGFEPEIRSETRENLSRENLKNDLLSCFSGKIKIPHSELKIKKCANRVPWIFVRETKLATPFSVSHHGRFSVFSMLQ